MEALVRRFGTKPKTSTAPPPIPTPLGFTVSEPPIHAAMKWCWMARRSKGAEDGTASSDNQNQTVALVADALLTWEGISYASDATKTRVMVALVADATTGSCVTWEGISYANKVPLGRHDSGTYAKNVEEWPQKGGANGSLRVDFEFKHGANADLINGDPKLSMKYEVDVTAPVQYPAEGKLSDAGQSAPADQLKRGFYRMDIQEKEKKKEIIRKIQKFRMIKWNSMLCFRLFILVVALASIPTAGGLCDTNSLSQKISNSCIMAPRSRPCCNLVTEAMDFDGGLACMCAIANNELFAATGLNISRLIAMYAKCGGMDVDVAEKPIHCEGTAHVAPPALPLPLPSIIHPPTKTRVVEWPNLHAPPQDVGEAVAEAVIAIFVSAFTFIAYEGAKFMKQFLTGLLTRLVTFLRPRLAYFFGLMFSRMQAALRLNREVELVQLQAAASIDDKV